MDSLHVRRRCRTPQFSSRCAPASSGPHRSPVGPVNVIDAWLSLAASGVRFSPPGSCPLAAVLEFLGLDNISIIQQELKQFRYLEKWKKKALSDEQLGITVASTRAQAI
ncbi:hypothetical protein PIB30_025685 [Stylosanthes scabra]|uniref:Uncharacterized protein n=1 Tax=Stylosanthes scabra TaxID=79078 RepID=A0ABU6X9A2_9FABA|nr:hypothetical protein [Stylosanthes scabra]